MPFETLADRVARSAQARAAARRRALAERLAAVVPADVRVEATEDGVRLSGRGLARRFALDARLRNLIEGLVR